MVHATSNVRKNGCYFVVCSVSVLVAGRHVLDGTVAVDRMNCGIRHSSSMTVVIAKRLKWEGFGAPCYSNGAEFCWVIRRLPRDAAAHQFPASADPAPAIAAPASVLHRKRLNRPWRFLR